jgi:catechol 2,3-dioxygenase-like lactoylglutathione lyase family enzyme
MSNDIHVTELDHVVLNVADVERSLAFYTDELGLAPIHVEEWRRGERFFPSVRISEGSILDLLASPRTGDNVDHICLVVEPMDFDALIASGRFEIEDGPAIRFGARGDGTAIYFRDPDRNLIELRYY